MMVDTIKERRTTEVIDKEFNEWRVSVQEILRDVVEDAGEKEVQIDLERLKVTVKRIGELIDHSSVRIAENMKEQNIEYFNEVEDGKAMIIVLVIEKAKKGFLGIAELKDRINGFPNIPIAKMN
jgi:hypothetical protein